MAQTVTRFRISFDKDAETVWLNDMAARGYAMTGFCMGFFTFEKCIPGEYLYQVDISEGMFRVSGDYRQFMAEAGVEIVCQWGYWVILRRRAEMGPFELYTDVESTIEHYKKIRKLFKVVIVVELLALLFQMYMASLSGHLSGMDIVFWMILGAFIGGLMREMFRINRILAELYGRLGRSPEGLGLGGRKVSVFLPVGLLLNSVVLIFQDYLWHPVRTVLQLAAVVLMILGLWRSCGRGGSLGE